MKRTQTKSYPFINQLSFWQKSTQTKRTLTDELPTGRVGLGWVDLDFGFFPVGQILLGLI